jgi:hypothetical protein
MNEHDNIQDHNIRQLLRLTLLERDGEDTFTQKLIDMEAQFVFGNEAIEIPSPRKEQEILNKLFRSNGSAWLKGLLGTVIVIVIAAAFFLLNKQEETTLASSQQALPSNENDMKELTGSTINTDSIKEEKYRETVTSILTLKTDSPVQAQQDIRPGLNEMNTGNIKTPGNTKLKLQQDETDRYANVPVLSQEQIKENTKFKEKMIKQVIKKDKDHWAFIPMSTEVYKGDTVSVNAFYIATTEVTNKEYRTFLYDLLAQDRVDDYLIAVPDSTQWTHALAGASSYERYYFSHPAYDNYPVVNVSRDGAQMYCTWLVKAANEKAMKDNPESKWKSLLSNDIRLPAELEWVTAARGGLMDHVYAWEGNNLRNKKGAMLANFKRPAESQDTLQSRSADVTAPVFSYWPNKYGLFCMSGNVAEMVWRHKTKQPGTKGGCWYSDNEHIKIDAEDEFAGITEGRPFIGFRPVMTFKIK